MASAAGQLYLNYSVHGVLADLPYLESAADAEEADPFLQLLVTDCVRRHGFHTGILSQFLLAQTPPLRRDTDPGFKDKAFRVVLHPTLESIRHLRAGFLIRRPTSAPRRHRVQRLLVEQVAADFDD